MGAAAVGLGAAGAAVNAYATYQQQKAAQNAAEYEAKVQQQNAQLAEAQAKDVESRGAIEEARYGQQVAGLLATQTTGLAASGVDVSAAGSSARAVLDDTTRLGRLDLLTMRQNAAREAYAQRIQGLNAISAASLATNRASATMPGLAASGTLLSGSAQVADSWYRYKAT